MDLDAASYSTTVMMMLRQLIKVRILIFDLIEYNPTGTTEEPTYPPPAKQQTHFEEEEPYKMPEQQEAHGYKPQYDQHQEEEQYKTAYDANPYQEQ